MTLLNFADGNFPSEFAAGDPALMEEERRLLYVAMTRARDALDLVVPLRYHVTQQARHPQLPNVPSVAEAGFPDLVVTSWQAAVFTATGGIGCAMAFSHASPIFSTGTPIPSA